MFRTVCPRFQEGTQFNARGVRPRGAVRLMDHHGSAVRGVSSQKPCVSVGASIEFSSISHLGCSMAWHVYERSMAGGRLLGASVAEECAIGKV